MRREMAQHKGQHDERTAEPQTRPQLGAGHAFNSARRSPDRRDGRRRGRRIRRSASRAILPDHRSPLCQYLLQAAQRKEVAKYAEPGDDTAADTPGIGYASTGSRVGEVHLYYRKSYLGYGCVKRRVLGGIAGGIDDGAVQLALEGIIETVDHLALDVGVE